MPMNSDDVLSSHFNFISVSGFLEMLLLCWSTQSHHDLLTCELCSAQYISNSLPVGVTSCGKCLNRCTFPKGLTLSSPHSIASRGLLSFLTQKHYLTTFGSYTFTKKRTSFTIKIFNIYFEPKDSPFVVPYGPHNKRHLQSWGQWSWLSKGGSKICCCPSVITCLQLTINVMKPEFSSLPHPCSRTWLGIC